MSKTKEEVINGFIARFGSEAGNIWNSGAAYGRQFQGVEEAINYLTGCGWLQEHDKSITDAWFQIGHEAGEKHIRNELYFSEADSDTIREHEDLAYQRGYEDGKKNITEQEAISYLKQIEWMSRHDKSISEESFQRGYQKGHEDGTDAGYDNGFTAGQYDAKEQLDKEYQRGHAEGYRKCLLENNFDSPCVSCNHPEESMPEIYQRGYENGTEHAWELAREILSTEDGILGEMFNMWSGVLVIKSKTYQEVKKRIEECEGEEEKHTELKVGDCVYDKSGNKCVVTNVDTHIHVIYGNGKTHKWKKSDYFQKFGSKAVFCDTLEFLNHEDS